MSGECRCYRQPPHNAECPFSAQQTREAASPTQFGTVRIVPNIIDPLPDDAPPRSRPVTAPDIESVLAEVGVRPDDLRYVLDSYAPTAKNQRGCPSGCGCTDCEMVEDLRALLDAAPEHRAHVAAALHAELVAWLVDFPWTETARDDLLAALAQVAPTRVPGEES